MGGSGRLSYWYFRKQAVLDGVGVSLFSRSSAHFPHQLQPLVLFPSLALPLAPLSPQVPILAHALLTLSRQEVRRRNALSPKSFLLPRNLLCFKSKSCSDYAADSSARLGRPWVSCRNLALASNSALWRGKPQLVPSPSATSPASLSPFSRCKGDARPRSPFSC